MDLVQEYTQTIIGLIPSDWEIKSLGECLKIKHGKDQKSIEDKNGKYPILGTGGLMNYTNSYLYDKPTVLIGRKGTIDKPQFMDTPFWTVDTLFYSEVSKNYSPKFLYYNFLLIDWYSYNEASGVPSLNAKTIEKILIPVPTLEEQTLIATALSNADTWITNLENLLTKKRHIKQGALQELLKPKKGWEVKKLGDLAFINMGQSPLSKFYNTKNIGIPLIQGNADIENRKTIIRNYTSKVTKKGKIGDVIMSVRAPVGEISKATFECCLGRGVCSISYSNDYLYHYLIHFEKSWVKLSTGSTFDSVNSKQLKELQIPLPKIEEQTRIATILSDMDAEIEQLETKLEKAKKVKQGMMQELLTGKTRLV